MYTILYITASLKNKGPINQLLHLTKCLNNQIFSPVIVSFGTSQTDSRSSDFEFSNIPVHSLNIGRWTPTILRLRTIKQSIKLISPDLIHSQGLRPDRLMSSINYEIPWVCTARNYPYHDYLMKFGPVLGKAMAVSHIKALRKCNYTVACSESIADQLAHHSINAKPIQNGTTIPKIDATQTKNKQNEEPTFISVGNLIKRKNMGLLTEAFQKYFEVNPGRLIILGDGPEMRALLKFRSSDRISFQGEVSNVSEYLQNSDYFVSASLSEGLPNTVLEALAHGLPCILSDIPPHQEIAKVAPEACHIFDLDSNPTSLAKSLSIAKSRFTEVSRIAALRVAREHFSDSTMSKQYQDLYLSILEDDND